MFSLDFSYAVNNMVLVPKGGEEFSGGNARMGFYRTQYAELAFDTPWVQEIPPQYIPTCSFPVFDSTPYKTVKQAERFNSI